MDKRRKWICIMLEEGLRLGVLSPEDILRHITAAVLATDLPPSLVAAILQAGIDTTHFDASLVVNTLGADNLADHMPLPLLWSCLEEIAAVVISEHPSHSRTDEDVISPGEVHSEDVPVIEVLED